jgi:ribA/ribD-fused uncharacterized protein
MTSKVRRRGFIFVVFIFSLCSTVVLAASKVVHVLPMLWDARQHQEGWKVLLHTDGNDIHADKKVVAGVTSESYAWDILKSIGLNRPGAWTLCFDNKDRNGRLNTFCFYEVEYKDYASIAPGFQWVRISHGNTVMPLQKINGYIQWALQQFLAGKVNSQQLGHQPVAPQAHAGVLPAAMHQRQLPLMIPALGQQVAYNPMPPMQGWYAIPGAILFDRESEPSFAFTNFYESQVNIPNYYTGALEQWGAVENYFQAMKTDDLAIQASLRKMTPPQALANKPVSKGFWVNVRFDVMRTALEAKFAPGTVLGNMLLSTDGRVLVEKTAGRRNREAEWGADDGLQGQNHLGRLLMVIRDSMKDRTAYPYNPQSTYTLQQINAVLSNGLPLEYARE